MAIELCSENPSMGMMSPRISFSHDLSQLDIIPVEQRLLRSISASSVDFDFCNHENFNQESISADELFSDGKILPTHLVKKTTVTQKLKEEPPSPALPPPHDHHDVLNGCKNTPNNENSIRTTKSTTSESDEKQKSKSFWQFKRSSSLNCGNGYARSLCPLPLLSRSNSTGSASSSKRSSSSKDSLNHKQHSQKTTVVASPMKPSQFSSSNNYRKPPLKKNGYGSSLHGNGVRINPVLNVPSANLFGLGSIFSSNNGKDKNKKKDQH